MNGLTIVLIVVLIAALSVLAFLAWRKLPQIKVVDPASSPEAQTRERKRALLERRLERQAAEKAEALRRSAAPLLRAVQNAFRRLAGKLIAIERRYVERQKLGSGAKGADPAELRRMVDQAHELMFDERFDAAEKLLIEVLSLDPKFAPGYEKIARLYLLTKNYDNAREALAFLVKLSPGDASAHAALGEVAEAEGEFKEAHKHYAQAKELSPNNPKYLDFFISSALEVGELKEARAALRHLKDVNPENKKISVFEDAIAEEAYQRKVAENETK